MKKRLLSLALCLALCLGLLPVGVLATDGDTEMSGSGNTTDNAANAAASVTKDSNTTYYTDVQTALDNASGGTVRFLQSLPNQALTVPGNVTIDLGNRSYSADVKRKLILNGAVTFLSKGSPMYSPAGGDSETVSYHDTDFSIPVTVANNGKMIVPKNYDSDTPNRLSFSSVTVERSGDTQLDGGSYSNITISDGGKASISGGRVFSLEILGTYDIKLTGGSYNSIRILETTYGGETFRTVTYEQFKALLEDGYGFYQKEHNRWVDADAMQSESSDFYIIRGKYLSDITVAPLPITSVSITGQFSIEYAETGDKATLTAEIQTPSTESNEFTFHWYQVKEDTKTLIPNATENTYVIPANQALGSYTYQVEVSCDGYVVESAPHTVTITPRVLLSPVADKASRTKVYDGTTDTAFTITGFYGDNNYPTIFPLTEGIDFVLTKAYYERPDVSKHQPPDNLSELVIIYSVELKNANYSFSNQEYLHSGSYGAFISKATAPKATEGTLTVANRHAGTYTFDLKTLLPELPAPQEYGTTQYELTHETNLNSDYYTEGATISNDGILRLPINSVDSSTEDGIGSIQVKVNSQNFFDFHLTLNVSSANKKVPTGTPTLSKTALTYGYKLSDITLSGSMKDGDNEVAGTFTWENPNEILTAGKHQAGWVFTPTNRADYIEVTGESEVTVAKATPSGTPSYTAITESAKTLEDAHLAVGTIQPEGFIQWVDADGNKINVSTEVKANTAYTWKFTPYDENYTDLTGTITLWHKSSSGSSSGAVTPGTKTDTVKNPDGSTTKTETKADGSKTETTTASSSGGSTGTTVTKTDAKGNTTTEASAKLSDQDVKEAQEKGEAVSVPVKGIAAAKDANAATKVKIDVPNNANKTTVEIPVENVTSGTVAVIVHEDGTEELVKDSKPTEHGVQLELSGSTTVKIIDNSKTFDDTKDHWSRDEVNFVAARELFNGVGGNQFGVSQPMTRGMVNTVLARLAGVDTTPSQGQTWYEVGTNWAKKNGISDGTNPTAPVTREQLATLLYRYAGSPSVSGTLHAADAASVSDYAEDALLWANQNGIVNGVGSNTIAPKDNAQRAQVAAMLARYLQNQ